MFYRLSFIFLTLLMLAPKELYAASNEGIPYSFLFVQVFNFIIFISIIIYFIVKKVPQNIKRRYKDYVSMNVRAQVLYEEACEERKSIKNKILRLEKREELFEEELKEEVSKLEQGLDNEMKEKCFSIIRVAQNFVDQELIRQKTKLKSFFVSKIEMLSVEICSKEKQKPLLKFKGG